MQNGRALVAIVEDDAEVRLAFARLLDAAGFATASFPSGESFLRYADGHRPDCVVLDLNLPGLNGFEVHARLDALHMDIPVVLVTGHDTPGARTQAAGARARAYLLKPVDEEALLGAIQSALAH